MRARSMGSAVAAALFVGLVVTGLAAAGPPGGHWTVAGQGLTNTRYQNSEHSLGVGNVAQLDAKWVFTAGGEVSATPAVDGQNVYFPDWAGNLYAVNRATGAQVWSRSLASVTGVPGDRARATPALAEGKLFIGNQGTPLFLGAGGGGKMLAFDAKTGAHLWTTVLDTNRAAIITQSATVHAGVVYVGVSSNEEAFSAFFPGYVCCSFRGSMYALDSNTGQILWKTTIVPAGYPGGAVWGSSPALDLKRGQVYIATGNNYDIPDSALACIEAAGDDPIAQQACIPADNYMDSIMALDMKTGAIRWVTKTLTFDAWTVQCIIDIFGGLNAGNCPEPAGPDYDFGQAPALFSVKSGAGQPQDVVGAGQKSGQYWALDAGTGAVLWKTQAGPGGTAGGLQWGSAVDGTRVYTANANSDLKPWPSLGDPTTGVWSGLDAATGQILWQTRPPHGGGTSGPVTTANGVVYGCSLDPLGYMYALNAATGAVLWEYKSGGSCLSGAAISNGTLYWGSGYTNLGPPLTTNNKLYAFSRP